MTALALVVWTYLKPHLGIVVSSLAGLLIGYHLGHPKAPESVKQTQQQVQAARDTVHQIDTLVKVKDRTLTKVLARYDTVRDTLRITTPPIHDTMWVKQEIQACDSLRSSCSIFQAIAHQKFHADSLLIGALGRENDAWKANRPSLGSKVKLALFGAATGLLADRIAIHTGH